VGQPILAAAGFQPALSGHERLPTARKAAWKGGCKARLPAPPAYFATSPNPVKHCLGLVRVAQLRV
jgi:hypothetical protein